MYMNNNLFFFLCKFYDQFILIRYKIDANINNRLLSLINREGNVSGEYCQKMYIYFFLECRRLHIPHESPQNVYYCLNSEHKNRNTCIVWPFKLTDEGFMVSHCVYTCTV